MRANLISRGIKDPNEGLKEGKYRTVVNMILGGSREQMRRLAFGDQTIKEGPDADNSQVTRKPDIENWAKDMYQFMAKKYGEENIVAFVVHLDELNPHIHCTLMPIDETGKFNYKGIFNGKGKKFGLNCLSSIRNIVLTEAHILPTLEHVTAAGRNIFVHSMKSVKN